MKVAEVLVNDFELVELTAVLDILRRADIQVDTISLDDSEYITSSNGVKIFADKKYSEIDLNEYDMLVLTGGKGTNTYLKYTSLIETIKEFDKKGKNIGAICAAPSILAKIGVLKDKFATVFPGYEKDLENNGARLSFFGVAKSKNIITATSVNFSIDFALELVETISGTEKRKLIEREIIRI